MSLWDGREQAPINRELLEAAQGPLPESSGVVLLPILVTYVVAQRYFVQGIVMSGMKG